MRNKKLYVGDFNNHYYFYEKNTHKALKGKEHTPAKGVVRSYTFGVLVGAGALLLMFVTGLFKNGTLKLPQLTFLDNGMWRIWSVVIVVVIIAWAFAWVYLVVKSHRNIYSFSADEYVEESGLDEFGESLKENVMWDSFGVWDEVPQARKIVVKTMWVILGMCVLVLATTGIFERLLERNIFEVLFSSGVTIRDGLSVLYEYLVGIGVFGLVAFLINARPLSWLCVVNKYRKGQVKGKEND